MKLRIRGNSLRLRLGQSEVRRLAAEGRLEDSTQFDPLGQQRLVYRLVLDDVAKMISAQSGENQISVLIPTDLGRRWANGDQVGLEAAQPIGPQGTLRILIETDFECIDARPDEPDDDAYPHPLKEQGCGPGNPPAPTARPQPG
jgi:hypothetical protein